MNKVYIIFIILLMLPITFASTLETNTTVTIDWVGNDQFWLRTESGDVLFNSSIQSDYSYLINITRTENVNKSDYDKMIELMLQVNSSCNSIQQDCDLYNYSETMNMYYEMDWNLTRCEEHRQSLRDLYNVAESGRKNCTSDLDSIANSNIGVQESLNNCRDDINSKDEEIEKIRSTRINYLLIGAVIVGVLWFVQHKNEEKHNKPKTMRDMGFGGNR